MTKNFTVGYDVSTSGSSCMAIDMGGNIIGVGQSTHSRIPNLQPGESRFRKEALLKSAQDAGDQLRSKFSVKPEDCLGGSVGGAMHGLCLVDEAGKCTEDIVFWDDQGDEEEAVFLSDIWQIPMAKRFTAARYLGWKKRYPDKIPFVDTILTPASLITFLATGSRVTLPGDASGMLGYLKDPYSYDNEKFTYVPDFNFKLPHIKKFGENIGSISNNLLGWKEGTPWVASCGDQPLGSLGKGCCYPGDVSVELGSSIVLNAFGFPIIKNQRGLIEALRSSLGDDMSMSCVTNGTQSYDIFANDPKHDTGYVGDQLYDHLSRIASEIPAGANGLMAFPFYQPEHALLHTKCIGAKMEGQNENNQSLANQTRAHMEAPIYILKKAWGMMIKDRPINKVIISGGGSKSDTWCQIVADMLGQKVVRTETKDSVAFGAALNALYMASGSIQDPREFISERVNLGTEFKPNLQNTQTYHHLIDHYFDTERRIYG